ncbi:MAG: hypothetical protein ACR2IF_10275 [Terriglobales bacterium]
MDWVDDTDGGGAGVVGCEVDSGCGAGTTSGAVFFSLGFGALCAGSAACGRCCAMAAQAMANTPASVANVRYRRSKNVPFTGGGGRL